MATLGAETRFDQPQLEAVGCLPMFFGALPTERFRGGLTLAASLASTDLGVFELRDARRRWERGGHFNPFRNCTKGKS